MDNRSYVSSAKNKAFKLIFFLVFFYFFSSHVYASDIVIGSDDVVFSFIKAVQFNNSYAGYKAFALSQSKVGSIFTVPRSQIIDNKIYIYNPDSSSYAYYVRGSSSLNAMSGISRGTGTSSKNNSWSAVTTLLNESAYNVSDVLLELDTSSWDEFDYYYISVNSYSTVDLGVANVKLFSKAYVPPTPSPIPSPVVTPSPGHVESSSMPSSLPENDNLDDKVFWITCYDQTWKNGNMASNDVLQRFVPSSVSDLTDLETNIHHYVYTYPVRIPFRVEISDFNGSGLFDATVHFDLGVRIQGLNLDGNDGITYLVDNSSPWIESIEPLSFNAVGNNTYGFGFDIFNVPLSADTSSEFFYCTDIYINLYSNHQFTGYGNYVDIKLSNITFDILHTQKFSDLPSDQILNNINNNIISGNEQEKSFHDEEQMEAEKAVDQLNSGLDQITGTLSSWEIVTMPVSVVQDLVNALQSEGSTGLTFPSFSLMGHTLWPSYTFDLNFIKENFPALYNALHLITGIIVVSWFIRYLWRKWHLLVGDDMPED